jgi:hypothetical protein
VDLFRNIESALGDDPAGERAQVLVFRWREQMDDASSGDPEVKAGLMKVWANRHHWPATLQWQMEGLHMLSHERFEQAATFLDAAIAAEARASSPSCAKNDARGENRQDRV